MLQKLGKNRAFPSQLILISDFRFLVTVPVPGGNAAEDAVIAHERLPHAAASCKRLPRASFLEATQMSQLSNLLNVPSRPRFPQLSQISIILQ
jgi:hypothetical protein